MRKKLIFCGLTGWCLEILFTAFGSFRRRNLTLTGHTSVWMFPIYSLAVFIGPVSHALRRFPVLLRSLVYACGFFIVEFLTGSFLKKYHACPWDYSHAKSNIAGVIRLDYMPFWMAAGLLYEKMLRKR